MSNYISDGSGSSKMAAMQEALANNPKVKVKIKIKIKPQAKNESKGTSRDRD